MWFREPHGGFDQQTRWLPRGIAVNDAGHRVARLGGDAHGFESLAVHECVVAVHRRQIHGAIRDDLIEFFFAEGLQARKPTFAENPPTI
jgi:hypothetical protein